jgi:PKD repeat protein
MLSEHRLDGAMVKRRRGAHGRACWVSLVRASAFALALTGWLLAASAAAQPVANFQVDPRQVEAGQTVSFKNTTNGGTPPLRFRWEFGDGATSSDASPTHVYLTPDNFTVRLTVTDALDQPHVKEDVVDVDGPTLLAAVLPVSRSVIVGNTATAFATVINAGHVTATGVKIQIDNATGPGGTPLPASFMFQTTDASTNLVTGSPNAPVDIPAGESRSFVIAVTPSVALAPIDVRFDIDGTNSTRDARTVVGLNTLLLSSSPHATPDVVALAAVPDGNGILTLAGSPRVGAFSVATVNVGAGGSITASADAGTSGLPISLSVCQTTPTTGQCETTAAPSVATFISAGATPTFAVFASSGTPVPFDPEVNRIFLRFRDASGAVRGATSVAVKGP